MVPSGQATEGISSTGFSHDVTPEAASQAQKEAEIMAIVNRSWLQETICPELKTTIDASSGEIVVTPVSDATTIFGTDWTVQFGIAFIAMVVLRSIFGKMYFGKGK